MKPLFLNVVTVLVMTLTASWAHADFMDLDPMDEAQYPVVISNFSDTENPAGFTKSVVSQLAFTDRITFNEAGDYRLTITDFGANESFNAFDYLGAFITSTTSKIAGFSYDNGVASTNDPWVFSVDKGEYWLSVLAVTDPVLNLGLFGFQIEQYTPVPLPAAAWFLLTSLLGLSVLGRKKGSQKVQMA